MPRSGINKRGHNWGAHPRRASDGTPRGPKRIYAVRSGHRPGVYNSVTNSEQRARAQLKGYSGAEWRAFSGTERRAAEEYVNSCSDESDYSDSASD